MVDQLQLRKHWDRLDKWFRSSVVDETYTGPRYRYQRKYFFSAAALAIRFLEGISLDQRLLISRLILNEDKMAVGNPECHIIGLIPFCQENPKLFIEHRISLWRNLIPTSCKAGVAALLVDFEYTLDPPEDFPTRHQIHSDYPGTTFSHFIMHILQALKEGLPPKSYSFILDGEPDLNHSTEIVKSLMKVYIAWLTTHTDCVAQGLLVSPEHPDYPLSTSPLADEIGSMDERSSIIQCNFTLDQPWDYESIVRDNEHSINRPRLNYLGLEPEFADISNNTVDLIQVKSEYFEMQPLSAVSSEETTEIIRGGGLHE